MVTLSELPRTGLLKVRKAFSHLPYSGTQVAPEGVHWGHKGVVTQELTRNDRKESDLNAQSHKKISTTNAAPEQSPII